MRVIQDMKITLNRILVVEGKEDASYLSNYIDSEIVVVNGYELSSATLAYLKNKPVILLMDPDKAGEEIRNKLNSALSDVVNVSIDIKKCNRGTKNGVAECEIDEVLGKLFEFCKDFSAKRPDFSTADLYELGLSSDKNMRNFVCEKLNLGNCNFKTMKKRLALNNINFKQVCEIIEEYKNGNK